MKRRNALLGGLAAALGAAVAQAQPDGRAMRDWMRLIELDAARDVAASLKAGQDPNALGPKGHAALHWALMHQSAAVVPVLMADPRTDLDLPNGNGETPLMLAALKGRLNWVRALVAKGAQIDPEPTGKRWRPLHYAASGESSEVVAWLLDQGATVDGASPNGTTALMLAWGYGPVDAAVLLMARGASQSVRNDSGLQAWDFAQRGGREDLAKRAGLRPFN